MARAQRPSLREVIERRELEKQALSLGAVKNVASSAFKGLKSVLKTPVSAAEKVVSKVKAPSFVTPKPPKALANTAAKTTKAVNTRGIRTLIREDPGKALEMAMVQGGLSPREAQMRVLGFKRQLGVVDQPISAATRAPIGSVATQSPLTVTARPQTSAVLQQKSVPPPSPTAATVASGPQVTSAPAVTPTTPPSTTVAPATVSPTVAPTTTTATKPGWFARQPWYVKAIPTAGLLGGGIAVGGVGYGLGNIIASTGQPGYVYGSGNPMPQAAE